MNFRKDSQDGLAELGFNLKDFSTAVGAGEGLEYLNTLLGGVDEKIAEIANTAEEAALSGDVLTEALSHQKVTGWEETKNDIELLKLAIEGFNEDLDDSNLAMEMLQPLAEGLGVSLEGLEDQFDSAGSSADDFRSILTGFDDTAYDLQGTFYDLADTIIRNGGAFDAFSVEGRNSMAALTSAMDDLWASADGDAVVFANNLAEAFAYVEGAGYNLIDSVDVLDQVLDQAFGTEWRAHLDTSQAHQSVKSYLEAVQRALEAKALIEKATIGRAMASGAAAMVSGDITGGIAYMQQANQARQSLQDIQSQISAVQNLSSRLGDAAKQGQQAGRRVHQALAPSNRGGGRKSAGQGAKDAQKATKDLQKELYTLQDYASDLSSIWDRAFEIRFSGQQTIDSVTTSIRGMAERFSEAEQRVKDLRLQLQTLRGDMSGLQAELSKQQYFLSIAMEYGDTARAEQIQARIIELQAELAQKQNEVSKTSKELSNAQKETSRTLTGNSDAAIRNRADLMSLVKEYQEHIKALASSGMNSKDLQRETERLRQDFVRQATQLGFNRKEIDKYTKGFRDVTTAIKKVPRKITVRASMSPAQQAVNEWIAKTKRRKASMTVNAKVKKPKSLGSIGGGQYQPSSIYSRGSLSAASISSRSTTTHPGGVYRVYRELGGFANPHGPLYRASGGPAEWAKMYAKGTDTIPAMLTPGEYVVKKQAVDFYGPEVMRAINNMQVPKRFFTTSGQMQNGPQVSGMAANGQRVTVDLSPSSVQAVAQAVQPRLVIDNKVIQQANGSANQRATSTGAR